MRSQRGGFAMGLVAGLLVGLAVALGVALYITKAPIPFVNKVPQRTAEQDMAETERNKSWDPNAALGGKAAARSAPSPASATPPIAVAASAAASAAVAVDRVAAPAASGPSARAAGKDPAAILSGGGAAAPPAAADPFIYFVQAGAYTRTEDAEQQRARLGLIGQTARITEREQAGRTVYRVRLGPFPSREEADNLQMKLQEQSIETQIVRVEKP